MRIIDDVPDTGGIFKQSIGGRECQIISQARVLDTEMRPILVEIFEARDLVSRGELVQLIARGGGELIARKLLRGEDGAVVTNKVPRSAPPNVQAVGRDTGSAIVRSSRPSGA